MGDLLELRSSPRPPRGPSLLQVDLRCIRELVAKHGDTSSHLLDRIEVQFPVRKTLAVMFSARVRLYDLSLRIPNPKCQRGISGPGNINLDPRGLSAAQAQC